MKVDLVFRIAFEQPYTGKYHGGQTLSRDDIAFTVIPCVGDGVIWDGDWAVETCVYRYVGPDYVEVGLGKVAERDIEAFIEAGWVLR